MNETALKLIEIAEQRIQIRGYNAFSFGDLAAELGIKTASIHYHFPSKADLGVAITDKYIRRFSQYFRTIDERHNSAPQRLRAYLDIYVEMSRDGRNCLAGMLAAEFATLPDDVKESLQKFISESEKWLVSVFRAGRNEGSLRIALNTESKARSFFSAVQGALIISNCSGNEDRFSALAQELFLSVKS